MPDFPAAGVNVDFSKNFIRGAARLMVADLSLGFPTGINSIVKTATTTQDEVQTITITGTPAGGTFTLSYKGYTTTAIPYNANAAAVDAALEALSTIGGGGVVVSGGPGPATPYIVTFAGQLAGQNVPMLSANATGLTGGTTPAITIVQTTPGFGQWAAQTGWTDLGATKGGVTVLRNNSEEVFTVDQIQAELASQPTAWEMNVQAAVNQIDLEMIQYLWEGGTITVDAITGERTLPLGTPPCYRQRILAVGFQRPSFDCVSEGGVAFFVFRRTQRTATESSIVLNSEGAQATLPFTWRCLADTNVTDKNKRFGHVIEQAT